MNEQSIINEWKKDSQSFDTIANLYDKFRPEYPPELVEAVINLSGILGGGRILEIGSGTGKATRLFARRGYSIHCIEQGCNLAAVAARNLQEWPGVTFETNRFEESSDRFSDFDLVISAQAFHWVPKEIGYVKAARALKPGGALALFWNMYPGSHGQIDTDLERIYNAIAPELGNPGTDSEEVIQERLQDINASGCFGKVTLERFPWSQTYRTREYLGVLNTYSDHLRLSAAIRQRLFDAISAAIDGHGGLVERNYVTVLYVAYKLS